MNWPGCGLRIARSSGGRGRASCVERVLNGPPFHVVRCRFVSRMSFRVSRKSAKTKRADGKYVKCRGPLT
jgi:hypothetical protein